MPQLQWEQHQPLKSSPSIQIKRLSIHHYLIYSCVREFELGRGGRNTIASSAEGELLPAGEYCPRIRNSAK